MLSVLCDLRFLHISHIIASTVHLKVGGWGGAVLPCRVGGRWRNHREGSRCVCFDQTEMLSEIGDTVKTALQSESFEEFPEKLAHCCLKEEHQIWWSQQIFGETSALAVNPPPCSLTVFPSFLRRDKHVVGGRSGEVVEWAGAARD